MTGKYGPVHREEISGTEREFSMRIKHIELRHLLAVFVVIASFSFLVGCGKKQAVQAAGPGGSSSSGGGRPPAPVVVANVEQRDIPVQLNAIGNVEAYQMVQVRSLVNGQIDRVHFKEGQDIRKGDLLFTLDKRPFQAELEKAIGALKRDEAQAKNTQTEAARYDSLEKEGVISRELADQRRSQAEAQSSSVYADRAAVDAARIQLQYTEIRAPIDARAGAVQIDKGNLVKANDTPFLVQLNQIMPVYVTFSIPETRLDDVRRYASGELKVLAYPKGQSVPAEGALTFIDNGVDLQTGTIKLKATFHNKDRRLWPGEFVNVSLTLSTQKNAIVIPTKAIQTGQQGTYVYVVTPQNKAESRPVTTSGTYQELTLVFNGLAPGERVVVDGQLRVVPNGNVMVQSTVPAGQPTSGIAPGGGM